MQQKGLVIIIAVLILIALGAFWYHQEYQTGTSAQNPTTDTTQQTATSTATTTPQTASSDQTIIGKSVQGRDIAAYHFGTGSKEILFIGGIGGGYEWNTALVAYQLMDYLKSNPDAIPAGIKVSVIPAMNPDGVFAVTGKVGVFQASDVNPSQDVQVSGRFNANKVDLNRNFDCDWKSTGVWQNKSVSGGTAAFSEPESQAVQSYVNSAKPAAVVSWYSSAGGVYASNCHGSLLPETKILTDLFAKASGYPAHDVWNYYELSGDMMNWLAKSGVPAVSVLLTNHTDTEWDKNQAGVLAVLKHYAQ
jgi:uncharacterized protein YdeI (BOF family)